MSGVVDADGDRLGRWLGAHVDRVENGGRSLVLRRPPVGAFCDDPDVIGAPFSVMERLHGVVPHEVGAVADLTAEQGRAPEWALERCTRSDNPHPERQP